MQRLDCSGERKEYYILDLFLQGLKVFKENLDAFWTV
jgi:hypothetical protein